MATSYTFIAPHGAGWLQANPSAIGTGLWIKTTDHGIILDDNEIPELVAFLQNYMSKRATELAKDDQARIARLYGEETYEATLRPREGK